MSMICTFFNKEIRNLSSIVICGTNLPLCPESSENIPILLQEADLCFSNQNDLRNPKMGSKQSVTGPTL